MVLLREPVSRAISNYHMNKFRKSSRFPGLSTLEEEVEKSLHFLEKCKLQGSADWRRCWQLDKWAMRNIVARGLYVFQLQRWLEEFALEQFFIVTTHEFFSDLPEMLSRVEDFIGVPHFDYPSQLLSKKYNTAAKQARSIAVDGQVLQRLQRFFQPYNQQLEQLLGRNLQWGG